MDSSGTSESARLFASKSDSPSHSYVQLSTTTPSVKVFLDFQLSQVKLWRETKEQTSPLISLRHAHIFWPAVLSLAEIRDQFITSYPSCRCE